MKGKIASILAALLALTVINTVDSSAAAAQKFGFKLMGNCAESTLAGTIEEDVTTSCYVSVTVNPAKPFRTVNLQYKDEAGTWQFANDDYGDKINKKTDAYKKVEVSIPAYDEDGVFYDFESREFRVYIPKSGSAAGVASKSIIINYTPAGTEGENVDSSTS